MNSHGTSESTPQGGMSEVPCAFSIVTEPFRTTPTDYLRNTSRALMPKIAVALAVPLIACLVASLWDLRFAFVALILVFLVFPMVIAYVYFSKLLTPQAQRAIWTKRIEFNGDTRKLTVVFESADEENLPPLPVTFSSADIEMATVTPRSLILRPVRDNFPLIIPLDAIPPGIDPYKLCSYYGYKLPIPQ